MHTNNYPKIEKLIEDSRAKPRQETVTQLNKRMKEVELPHYPTSAGAQAGLDNCNALVNGADYHAIMSDSSGEY